METQRPAESSARKTPFHDVFAELGGEFVEYIGGYWPDHFGDVPAEYRLQREHFGVFDASAINKWDFRGPDATVAAQRVHTNNIAGEAIGQVRYGAFCDENGLMIDDGTVFKLADDHLWVMTNFNTRAEHFAAATSDLDVEIEDITPTLPHLFFQGPESRAALAKVTDADLDSLGYFRFLPDQVKVAGVPVWLSRTGVSGELGYEFFCRPEDAEELLRNLIRDTGVKPYGLQAIEPVRIESGVIVTETDYPEHTYTPFDLSFDRLVDLEQDFLGRDALAKLDAEPRRKCLTTLRLSSSELPEYSTPILDSGNEVGTLTSPTVSPLYGPIGLAILDVELARPGREVQIGDGTATGVVNDTHPAYDPEKRRPRS
ncbi:MAG: aminomethyltransferase family protein [Actinobacteria bacterium]|nr:aminomethyltransferase family protein [Actinomycetota bacterium]